MTWGWNVNKPKTDVHVGISNIILFQLTLTKNTWPHLIALLFQQLHLQVQGPAALLIIVIVTDTWQTSHHQEFWSEENLGATLYSLLLYYVGAKKCPISRAAQRGQPWQPLPLCTGEYLHRPAASTPVCQCCQGAECSLEESSWIAQAPCLSRAKG